MPTASDNFQRLREAGIIRTDELPEEYLAVIDSLDAAQVDVMLDVWERLQAADRESGAETRPGEAPRWTTWMFF
jgi:hypothetical protein